MMTKLKLKLEPFNLAIFATNFEEHIQYLDQSPLLVINVQGDKKGETGYLLSLLWNSFIFMRTFHALFMTWHFSPGPFLYYTFCVQRK